LGEVGELSEPIDLGIASNSSRRRKIYPDTADLAELDLIQQSEADRLCDRVLALESAAATI